MKRRQIVKWLMLITVTLVATVAWGDVASPPWHTFSHLEWMGKMAAMEMRTFVLLRFIVPYLPLVLFPVVLVFSLRKRQPSCLLWLAFCAPLVVFIPLDYESDVERVLVLSVFGVPIMSWLVSVIYYFSIRKFKQAWWVLIAVPVGFVLFLHCVNVALSPFGLGLINGYNPSLWEKTISVEVEKGETYEEYLKRANRIINHLCDRCDKPMRDYWHDYWRCPDCDKDEMTCSKCGAGKVQEKVSERKGKYHWQMGIEWLCPNCDKERRRNKKAH